MPTKPPSPDKSRGQHFLTDPRVAAKTADLLELSETDAIVEIGPGRGALTRALLETGKRIVAIEIDPRMVAHLRQEFGDRVEICEADVLTVEPGEIVGEEKAILVGNLPYNMGGPILEWVFRSASCWLQVVVMLQLEVARRLVAEPQTRDFGPLAVARALHFDAQKRFLVRPGAFFPPPKVTSAVVELVPNPAPPLTPSDREDFLHFVHGLFAHRRKHVLNNLELYLSHPREELTDLFTEAGVDPRARAEQLSYADLDRLYARLRNAAT